jgi:hypothetical protein
MSSALRAHAQVWLWRGFSKKWAVLASEVQISEIWNSNASVFDQIRRRNIHAGGGKSCLESARLHQEMGS